jgi:hypothetical protein
VQRNRELPEGLFCVINCTVCVNSLLVLFFLFLCTRVTNGIKRLLESQQKKAQQRMDR